MALRDMFIAIGYAINPQGLSEADARADAFRDNLLGAETQGQKLGNTMTEVGAAATAGAEEASEAAKGLAGWWDENRKKVEGFGQTLKENRKVIAGVVAITMGLVGMSVKVAADFEQAMSRVGAVSRASEEDMALLTAQARELGATTAFSASQAAEGMEYLAMAGFNTQQTISAMPGLLDTAAAAGESLGRSADIVSNILSGFNLEAEETGRIADVLTATFTSSNTTLGSLGDTMKMVAPVAASLGISIEETAALAGKLGDAGIQGSMAGTSLRTVLTSLVAPSGEAAKQMAALGIQTTDAAGNMLPIIGIIGQIADKTSHMGEAQRAAFLEQLAGRQGIAAMSALLSVGADRLEDYTASLQASGGVAAEVAGRQMDNLAGAMTEMRSAIEGAQIAIGNAFIPVLRVGARAITSVVTAFNRLPGPLQTTIAVGLGVVGVVSSLALAASFLIPQIGAAIKMFGLMRTALAATRVGAVLTGTAINAALWPVIAVVGIVTGAVLLFQDALTFLRGEGDSVIGRFYAWTEDIGFFGDVLRSLADPIVQPFIALADVFRYVRGESGTMTEATIQQLTDLYDATVLRITEIGDWFRTLPDRTITALTDWGANIRSWFAETFDFGPLVEQRLQSASDWFSSLPARTIEGLTSWWDSIKAWFAETFDFGAVLSNAFEAAMNIIPAPLRGIAEKIMDFFPQSPAKEGPLANIDRVGLGLMGELARSIEDASRGKLEAALGDVAVSMAPDVSFDGAPGRGFGAAPGGEVPQINLTVQVDARGATADDAEVIGQTTAERIREVFGDIIRESFHSTVMQEA